MRLGSVIDIDIGIDTYVGVQGKKGTLRDKEGKTEVNFENWWGSKQDVLKRQWKLSVRERVGEEKE